MTQPIWIWLNEDVLYAVHDEQLAEHGGQSGVRDASLFESAMGKPQNLAAFGEPDAEAEGVPVTFGEAVALPVGLADAELPPFGPTLA